MSTEGIRLFHEVDRVKERRRERMERIRMQPRDSYTPFVDDWKDPIDTQEELFSFSGRERNDELRPTHEKWGIQVLVSLFLIGMAYVVFQTTMIPLTWKDSAREVMTRDFNFAGVADWYEAKFGSIPTILPTFPAQKPAVPAASTEGNDAIWKLPAHWKVAKTYEPQSAKVVLATGISDQVTIGETGWVAFVGEKPGYGTTVVVRLTQGREVWFGNLDGVRVTKDEVLQPGQVVGTARSVNQTSRHLYLGYAIHEEFVNPLEVIPFE